MSTHSLNTSARVRPGSGEMFDRIANRYDLLNRVMSLGIDQRWRRQAARCLGLSARQKVLDVATGTGDLALCVAATDPSVTVVGLDPSPRMLEIAEQKALARGVGDRVQLCRGDAQALPFENDSFDAVCIGFGIRNVPDRTLALTEMLRVTRPAGRLSVLELSEPKAGGLGLLARFHVHQLVPLLGSLLSGTREYRYLQESIAAFPPAEEFRTLIESAGWTQAEAKPLTFGVAHLYRAVAR